MMALHVGAVVAIVGVASPPPAAITLWQNVEAGMTIDRVHALYPQDQETIVWKADSVALKNFHVTPSCKGRVNIRFNKGLASSVEIDAPLGYKSFGNAPDCGDQLRNALIRKWGNPSSDHEKDSMTSFKGIRLDHNEWSWATVDGVDISLQVNPGDDWHLVYKAGSAGAAI